MSEALVSASDCRQNDRSSRKGRYTSSNHSYLPAASIRVTIISRACNKSPACHRGCCGPDTISDQEKQAPQNTPPPYHPEEFQYLLVTKRLTSLATPRSRMRHEVDSDSFRGSLQQCQQWSGGASLVWLATGLKGKIVDVLKADGYGEPLRILQKDGRTFKITWAESLCLQIRGDNGSVSTVSTACNYRLAAD